VAGGAGRGWYPRAADYKGGIGEGETVECNRGGGPSAVTWSIKGVGGRAAEKKGKLMYKAVTDWGDVGKKGKQKSSADLQILG